MDRVSGYGNPTEIEADNQAASGRPFGVGPVTYADAALQLLDHGYEPIPVIPGQKRPAPNRWSSVAIDEAMVEDWSGRFPDHSIGLRTGRIVGVDLDILDPDLAHRLTALTGQRLGETLVRIGLHPKRLLLYRTEAPFSKLSCGKVEILGLGQQFVAFGRHPDTGRAYSWPGGETPLEVPIDQLPQVSRDDLAALLAEMEPLLPAVCGRRSGPRNGIEPAASTGPARDARGLVIEGRDSWLSTLAFHAVHDALDTGEAKAGPIADLVWRRFAETADLERSRRDSHRRYEVQDALRKVADKLRLAADGRLPARDVDAPEPGYTPALIGVEEARTRLGEVLSEAMARIEAWWGDDFPAVCPQIGIKATVGLGKSTAARSHVLELRQRLLDRGKPARIAVFTPSHALAEEAAAQWRAAGLTTAVLRGYEKRHPVHDAPMCANIAPVRIAIRAGLDVHASACDRGQEERCSQFDTCLKQQNRREVSEAEVIVAPYDALFTGFASDTGSIGLLVVDEGCWQRAATEVSIALDAFGARSIVGLKRWGSKDRNAGRMADLNDARQRLFNVLSDVGPGPIARSELLRVGLTADLCRTAARLEEELVEGPDLRPGLAGGDLVQAEEVAMRTEARRTVLAAWRALAELVEGGAEHAGRLRIRGEGRARKLVLAALQRVHHSLAGKPVLHLDATLRPKIARRILPDLDIQEVEAAAPHMEVRLVTGSFGKGTLCVDARASGEENERRTRRLAEVIEYVRWHAGRGGATLVITYKACEDAFGGIPNVRTAHFNAIAGLDAYRDVDRLIIIGRPLPSDADLVPLCGALFGHEARGGYRASTAGIWMRDGRQRTAPTLAHGDECAEELRQAICEDEVIQAIGRGRGVNRTGANPLEVHVLGNLALPLVHDRLEIWDSVAPDVFQRMLLAGIAVDSPADAAVLHPDLFATQNQAQKQFGVAGFQRQNPMGDTYREMAFKSARYRKAGRGQSWQSAFWLEGADQDIRRGLKEMLGRLEGWVTHE